MYSVEQSETFSTWLHELRDSIARVRIAARISMAKEGNLGDCASLGVGCMKCGYMSGRGIGSIS